MCSEDGGACASLYFDCSSLANNTQECTVGVDGTALGAQQTSAPLHVADAPGPSLLSPSSAGRKAHLNSRDATVQLAVHAIVDGQIIEVSVAIPLIVRVLSLDGHVLPAQTTLHGQATGVGARQSR